jgi:hypothetical protein
LENGLPNSLWIKVVNTTNYVVKHSSSHANQGNTCKELWLKNKLGLGHLRIFGCVVLVIILIPKGKNDSKS